MSVSIDSQLRLRHVLPWLEANRGRLCLLNGLKAVGEPAHMLVHKLATEQAMSPNPILVLRGYLPNISSHWTPFVISPFHLYCSAYFTLNPSPDASIATQTFQL